MRYDLNLVITIYGKAEFFQLVNNFKDANVNKVNDNESSVNDSSTNDAIVSNANVNDTNSTFYFIL